MLIGKSNIHSNKGIQKKASQEIKQGFKEPEDSVVLGQLKTDDEQSKKLFELRRKLVDPEGKIPDSIRTEVKTGTAGKGTDTVEIGTFNIEWLGSKGRKEEEFEKLAQIIKDSGAEAMGLQEITDEKALKRILKYLPDFDYILGTTGVRRDGKKQHVGVIYNKKRITPLGNPKELMEAQVPDLMGDDHLRAPLIVDMKAENFDFTMVVIHNKARMDDRGKKIRGGQAKEINKWLKEQANTNPDKDIIVVGDYNDFVNSKTTKTMSSGVLYMSTAEAAARGEYSNIPHKSLIDQVGITSIEGGAEGEYIKGSAHVMDTRGYKGYRRWGSDHNPVVASFKNVDNDPGISPNSTVSSSPAGEIPAEATEEFATDTLQNGEKTVEIGSFNIEWLGSKKRKEKDFENLAKVIKDSGAEVMGLQEITDEKALKRMLKHLPGFDYVLGTTGVRNDGSRQHIGLIYNKERAQVVPGSMRELTEAQVPHLIGDTHLRAPLAVDMKADNFDFTLVVVHFKARMDAKNKDIRTEQAKIVNKWIKDEVAKGNEKDIIVVGDFNDFLSSKSTKAVGDGILNMTTKEAEERGEYSNIPHHSLIDQIGITNSEGGAVEEYIEGSTHVVDTKKYPGYRKWGSDHNPVISSFKSDKDND